MFAFVTVKSTHRGQMISYIKDYICTDVTEVTSYKMLCFKRLLKEEYQLF